jgi:hypothetical protein
MFSKNEALVVVTVESVALNEAINPEFLALEKF